MLVAFKCVTLNATQYNITVQEGIMKLIKPNQCENCTHYKMSDGYRVSCRAYPEGIPIELFIGAVSHDLPYPGDSGYRYQYPDIETVRDRIYDYQKSGESNGPERAHLLH
jgi:hypothetical protein